MIFKDMDRIVFAGDSVTDMGSVNPIGEGLFDNAGHGYVRLVDSLLATLHPEIRVRVTNAGISGNTSRMLLERFERDVIALSPNIVSICIGINDVWRQFDAPAFLDQHVLPDEYERNLEEMITRAKAVARAVFVLSPYYIEPNREDKMRARMDEYVAICERLAKKHDCPFVNFQKMYEDYCTNYRHSSYIAWDRVHPNQVGSMLMAKAFLAAAGVAF